MNEIHEIMGQKHTTQILDVLDALGADWMKVEQFYEAELARGAKNILTGQPLTEEQAADELWSDLTGWPSSTGCALSPESRRRSWRPPWGAPCLGASSFARG